MNDLFTTNSGDVTQLLASLPHPATEAEASLICTVPRQYFVNSSDRPHVRIGTVFALARRLDDIAGDATWVLEPICVVEGHTIRTGPGPDLYTPAGILGAMQAFEERGISTSFNYSNKATAIGSEYIARHFSHFVVDTAPGTPVLRFKHRAAVTPR